MNTKKIKVLFRLRSMETGGVQKVLINILKNLDKDRFELTLLLNFYQGELLRDIPDSIKLCYIGKGREFLSKNSLIQKFQLVCRRLKLIFYNKFPSFLYKKLDIKKHDIEIAFFHYNFKEILNSPNKKSKKVGWMHGDIRNTGFSDEKNIEIIGYINRFDTCVFVSNQTKNVIEEHYKININNPEIIYNPIDINDIIIKSLENTSNQIKLDKDNGIKTFISIGRITIGKGYQVLLKVHKKLIDDGIYHKIYIIGEGNYKNEIEKEIKICNLEDTFIFLGEKKNPYSFLNQANFFVLPSFSEAYPLVIAESLILGKPIITTDVGGIREMMEDQKNGIFIKSKNEQELYNAMKLFLEDEDKVNKIIENNIRRKDFFNPERVYKQIENLLIK